MPRGRASAPGTETVNANGYTQVKTDDRGWVGKHTLVLEEKLGRKLNPGERAVFSDNDRTNFDPENIELSASSLTTLKARIAKLEAEIEDRQSYLEVLRTQLKVQTSS